MKHFIYVILWFVFITLCISTRSQNSLENLLPYISLEKFQDGIHHWNLFSNIREYDRLDTTDIIGIADNITTWQNIDGGWPKNIDWLAKLNIDSVKMSSPEEQWLSTFDNRNIFPQIEYLAKAYHYTGINTYRESALKGLFYILNEQHKNGGWKGSDVDAITFNDDVMTGIMNLLLDIVSGQEYYNWIDTNLRKKLHEVLNKAISATLKCQIEVNGIKTAWCQQHDNYTYEPVKARSYELPSITARESTDVVLFLMRLPSQGDSVVQAIESAITWFEKSKIEGFRYDRIEIPEVKYHETRVDYDQVFIPDTTAKPVWARYYDIETNKPFLCRRDGEVVYNLNEIGFERRIGYAWYGYWPEDALKAYMEWKSKVNND